MARTAPASNRYLDNFNPATGAVPDKVPTLGPEDLELAVQAARAAFPAWAALRPEQRHDILRAVSDGILQNLDKLAEAESADSGKTITTARTIDIPRSALNFKFFATALLHFSSESHHQPGVLSYTLRQPVGITGCISPWNLPLYLFTWKIAPALAAGNCVIGKPSEVTPLTAWMLGDICRKAGTAARGAEYPARHWPRYRSRYRIAPGDQGCFLHGEYPCRCRYCAGGSTHVQKNQSGAGR
jgi:aminomuconate-semialdehyde/2-hydroxymuconate-6-semialdehyde dehydrogenase